MDCEIPHRLGSKNLKGKPERESSKRTISVGGGLELLQMVLELDTGQCAGEEAEFEGGWT